MAKRARDLYPGLDTSSPFWEGVSAGQQIGSRVADRLITAEQVDLGARERQRRSAIEDIFAKRSLEESGLRLESGRRRAVRERQFEPLEAQLRQLEVEGRKAALARQTRLGPIEESLAKLSLEQRRQEGPLSIEERKQRMTMASVPGMVETYKALHAAKSEQDEQEYGRKLRGQFGQLYAQILNSMLTTYESDPKTGVLVPRRRSATEADYRSAAEEVKRVADMVQSGTIQIGMAGGPTPEFVQRSTAEPTEPSGGVSMEGLFPQPTTPSTGVAPYQQSQMQFYNVLGKSLMSQYGYNPLEFLFRRASPEGYIGAPAWQ
jgi:hypothetical protein